MTRAERIRVACERFAEGPPEHLAPETVNEGIEAALDAALADLGGLDGLTLLADLTDQARPMEDRRATLVTTEFYERLLADRDRLRDALRETLGPALGPHTLAVVENALRESEAGS